MRLNFKKILALGLTLLYVTNFLSLISISTLYSQQNQSENQTNDLPFNDFYLHYLLKAKKDSLPMIIPKKWLSVQYTWQL